VPEAFEELVAPYRRELLAHCYRMTGAKSDADDALQDALVRAWRAFERFEGRASLRTWLYKIATNACLDLISSRKARTMPEFAGPPGQQQIEGEPLWLEPLPEPDAAFANREAVRLAFIIALQVLPPRQRATLILRDVVGMSAEETAAALETSVASVNSALQRARATIDEHPRAKREPITGAIGELLGRYLKVFESGDAAGLVALLAKDAILSMPPMPLWIQGAEAISGFLGSIFAMGRIELVPCRVNGQPAFASYQNGTFLGVTVLDIEDEHIKTMHTFMGGDPTPYELPRTAPPRTKLAPGGALGRYRLEYVLGAGGMGAVWLAHDTQLDRKVALKVLQPELATSADARARLLQEARAMAKLRHPNITTVWDAGAIDGIDFLAMELVDGVDMAGWLRTDPPRDEIFAKLLAAGRGLAAAHAAGVVHRDFKPDNVMIGNDGRVLVSDFGLASPAQPQAGRDLTQPGMVVGTPAYMAPEQKWGADVDARADQFAYCVTAWEAFSGERVRDDEATSESVPPQLVPILRRGLAFTAEERWPSMDALLAAISSD
jgi:RNA polymerase sigma-70 factor (ECF subfamily)